MIARPQYLDRIRPFIGKPVLKVLKGIRRAGKSTILKLVAEELRQAGVRKEQIIEIDFERYSNRALKDPDAFYEHISRHIEASGGTAAQHYLFLDVVQELERWELVVPGLQQEFNADIYLTGSNAHFLSSEFASYLSGRYVEFDVYPLSFAEFCTAQPWTSTAEAFDVYRTLGGFPLLAQIDYDPRASIDYLNGIYNTVVIKDIVTRAKIQDVTALNELLAFAIANIGHTFSARNAEAALRCEGTLTSTETVIKYLAAACNAHLLYEAPRVDAMSKKVFKNQQKYYLADIGLREAVYGNNGRNIDQVLENLVYLELLRCGWKVQVGAAPIEGLGKAQTAPEIDFVAKRGSETKYFQVCYLLANDETVRREYAPLKNLREDWPKYVLSLDEVDRSEGGIAQLNIRQFLLDAESILG